MVLTAEERARIRSQSSGNKGRKVDGEDRRRNIEGVRNLPLMVEARL